MSWTCSLCGFGENSDEANRCVCGYEIPIEVKRVENVSPYELASISQRFLNSVIDHIAMFPIGMIFGFVLRTFGWRESQGEAMLVGMMIFTVYYFTFEVITGRTCAKYITGTKAVDTHGKDLTVKKALYRTLCRFIPFEPLSFIASSRGWHDNFSGTIVVTLKKPNTVTQEVESSMSSEF